MKFPSAMLEGDSDAVVHDVSDGAAVRLSSLAKDSRVVIVLFRHCL